MSTFLYAEVQASVPFAQAPWQTFNPAMKKQPGLLRKTWLSGLETLSVGGIYEFDTLQNARNYVANYLVHEARNVGGEGSLMTRFYDAAVTKDASLDMNSPWLKPLTARPAPGRVYLLNDMNWNIAFPEVPWRAINQKLKAQPGLLTKQWLSGINTRSVCGLYDFDSKQNALNFAFGMIAEECKALGVTTNLKLFDADITEDASRDMNSPYYY